MEAFIVASFVGVVIGAVLQYYFAQRSERLRNTQQRRTEAYVDLIKAISTLSKLGGDGGSDAFKQASALYAEARTRIAIYGSVAVNAKLATFLRAHTEFASPEALAMLTEVVKAMRTDGLGNGEPLPDADIKRVLFGRD